MARSELARHDWGIGLRNRVVTVVRRYAFSDADWAEIEPPLPKQAHGKKGGAPPEKSVEFALLKSPKIVGQMAWVGT